MAAPVQHSIASRPETTGLTIKVSLLVYTLIACLYAKA